MSSETQTAVQVEKVSFDAPAGAIAGIVGSAVMGVLLFAQMPDVVEMAIPAMYGVSGPAVPVGFGMHLVHGAVFGVIFAAALSQPSIGEWATSRLGTLALGVGYGVSLWVVAAVVVMPLWLSAVGFPAAPPLPNVSVPSHLFLVGSLASLATAPPKTWAKNGPRYARPGD